jgi:DnaJ-domain-containing protein 1
MAGAMFWAAYRRGRTVAPSMPVEDARKLLGVGPSASLTEIRDAHRRLIARVHPDTAARKNSPTASTSRGISWWRK